MPARADIDQAVLAAHASDDRAALARAYWAAAHEPTIAPDADAAAFLLTQAYIFALDCGDAALAGAARRKLCAAGREWSPEI